MPIPKDPVTEPERERLDDSDLENKTEASSEEDSRAAPGSADLCRVIGEATYNYIPGSLCTDLCPTTVEMRSEAMPERDAFQYMLTCERLAPTWKFRVHREGNGNPPNVLISDLHQPER